MSEPLSWPARKVVQLGTETNAANVVIPNADGAELDDVRALVGSAYQVIRQLGRGGMAVVYLAVHNASDRSVAIKLLRGELAMDGESRTRFRREAETVARLRHEHIMELLDVLDFPDGRMALVLEFAAGGTVKSRLVARGAGLTGFDTINVIRAVAQALAFAHKQGVIHRDIKPDNVFFTDNDRVLLGDFGIAFGVHHDHLTIKGEALGTPAYMAPEQFEDASVTAAADIYSLALLAYEMLGARAPWAGESLWSIVHKQKTIELPNAESTFAKLSNVEHARLLRRCLAKNPNHRPQHGGELLAALDAPSQVHCPAPLTGPISADMAQYPRTIKMSLPVSNISQARRNDREQPTGKPAASPTPAVPVSMARPGLFSATVFVFLTVAFIAMKLGRPTTFDSPPVRSSDASAPVAPSSAERVTPLPPAQGAAAPASPSKRPVQRSSAPRTDPMSAAGKAHYKDSALNSLLDCGMYAEAASRVQADRNLSLEDRNYFLQLIDRIRDADGRTGVFCK